MPFYRMNLHAATSVVAIESGAGAAPAAIVGGGYTSLGTFKHDPVADTLPGAQTIDENHTIYHHVQEACYQVDRLDMSVMTLYIDKARSISIGVGAVVIAVDADSAALVVTSVPENADKSVTYSSSDITKATVNALGVIHGVAAGAAVITATLDSDPTITATRAVTVNP